MKTPMRIVLPSGRALLQYSSRDQSSLLSSMLQFVRRTITVLGLFVYISWAAAASVVQEAIPLDSQIANSSTLALVRIGNVEKVHERMLDVSGDKQLSRLFVDVHYEVAEWYKLDEASKVPESGLLRVANSLDPALGNEWVFPIRPGELALVALLPDAAVPDAGEAFTVQQDVYHPLENDQLHILHQGKIVDQVSLDDLRHLVELDQQARALIDKLGEQELATGQEQEQEQETDEQPDKE